MAILFQGTKIKKLRKFRDFWRDLQWDEVYALGFLASFWSEVMELQEDGEITGWTSEYICELTGVKADHGRVWKALKDNNWIDITPDNRVFVHDWLESAGSYLIKKYSTNNKKRLREIWALYGMRYGQKYEKSKRNTATKQRPNSDQIASVVFDSIISDSTISDKSVVDVKKSDRIVVDVDNGNGKSQRPLSAGEAKATEGLKEFSGKEGWEKAQENAAVVRDMARKIGTRIPK